MAVSPVLREAHPFGGGPFAATGLCRLTRGGAGGGPAWAHALLAPSGAILRVVGLLCLLIPYVKLSSMPALPNVPQVVRFTFVQKVGTDLNMVNRFYQKYSAVGPLGGADATTWAAAASAAWAAHLAPSHNTDVTLESVTIEDLSSDTGAVGVSTTSHSGGDSDPILSAGAALVISQKIARRYRGGHPRQYLGGFSQPNLSTPQTWEPGILSGFPAFYTAFRAAVAAGCPVGLQPAVDVSVSYYHGFTIFTPPSGRSRPVPTLRAVPIVDVISEFTMNPKVASQRRRNLQSA